MKFEESNSELFKENLTYRPFHYPNAVEMDKEHEKAHWIEDEVPLTGDVSQWKNGEMTEDGKSFITNNLKMFTLQDVLVGTFYTNNLIPYIKNNEVRNLLIGFAGREKTHQRAYALLNDTLGLPDEIYTSFLDYSDMRKKAEFALDVEVTDVDTLAFALAKGVFNEGMALFSSFAMLLNFKRLGKMRGMGTILDWSILDEKTTLDTEVLTENGWIRVGDVKIGDKILEWNTTTQETSFQEIHTIKDHTSDYSFVYESKNFHQHVSAGHRMIIEENGKIEESTGEDLDISKDFNFIMAGKKEGNAVLNVELKERIAYTLKNNESLDWLYPILPEISSDMANEILEFYSDMKENI